VDEKSTVDRLPIDVSVAHPARRYNYWLGGKDNFAADRESGDAVLEVFPGARIWAQENRNFLRRVVTYLVREAGIRQFLDIGTGIPTANNTHEVAQSLAPATRVVYVDNDPIVLVHARALLTSAPEGRTAYVDADFRDPERILTDPDTRNTLDFAKPTALMLLAVLHFFPDSDRPYEIVARLVDALAPGSYLAISHGTGDFMSTDQHGAMAALGQVRSRDELARFFTGMEFVEPGISSIENWRPDSAAENRPTPTEINCYGAVARIL
jgi:trans-aconitate methyltransferase